MSITLMYHIVSIPRQLTHVAVLELFSQPILTRRPTGFTGRLQEPSAREDVNFSKMERNLGIATRSLCYTPLDYAVRNNWTATGDSSVLRLISESSYYQSRQHATPYSASIYHHTSTDLTRWYATHTPSCNRAN